MTRPQPREVPRRLLRLDFPDMTEQNSFIGHQGEREREWYVQYGRAASPLIWFSCV